ncbi:hypothetical protein TNCV_4865701 [Trichonephila clavipes]|nr:hypothetical protein TNCV_4865701 [Trichonephila clavipes]
MILFSEQLVLIYLNLALVTLENDFKKKGRSPVDIIPAFMERNKPTSWPKGQKRISTLTDLAVGKSWSRLLDGERRAQLSTLPTVEGVACFRVITGHDYLQAYLFNISLADSLICPLCKSVPMTGDHLSDCPSVLHFLSQDNCGVLPPSRATSALYWTARRLMSERPLACVIKKKPRE